MNDTHFMKLAISRAEEGVRNGQSPFGAVIVKDGTVISREHNHVWETMDPTAHAEIVAIRKASGTTGDIDLNGCTIYTTCEPCPMCFAAIHWARIKKIIFGVRIGDAESLGFNEIPVTNIKLNRDWNAGIELIQDFMRDENLKLMELWRKLSNKPY